MTQPPSAPPRFGKYELVSKLGMGGMAEVFKANYRGRPDVAVAIKKILPHFAQDKKLVSMLVNEARLSMNLNHPNIVPVLDFGIVDGDYFIAMEYVHGKDLKSIMIRCKMREIELPAQMAVYIATQVLRGLDYAHNKRDNFDQPLDIVHRDVSPHNVLISLWGQVKILDFGIAKASHIASSTQTGILKGKFSYMSPEQALGKQVDLRTDIYSAGILLWELLTLESYFSGVTDIKLLERVREARPKDPREINPNIPKPLAQLVMRALQKKPRKRWKSAEDFARALEKFQADTFGQVTDMDLAAYVRNLFGVSAAEIADMHPAVSARDVFKGDHDKALAETMAVGDLPPPPPRPVRRRSKETPAIFWQLPILVVFAAGLAVLFRQHSPTDLFRMFDRQVLNLAGAIHALRPPPASQDPVLIDLEPAPAGEASYTLFYSPEVKREMEDLPFEQFEEIRNRAMSLSADPQPTSAAALPNLPGSWAVDAAGYRLIYKKSDSPRTVTIMRLEKEK